MGHSNIPSPAQLLPLLMLVLQLSLVSAILRAKRLRVGDCWTTPHCTALHRGVECGGVEWCSVGWCGVALVGTVWHGVVLRGVAWRGVSWGAAARGWELLPSHPAPGDPAEMVEEVEASDEDGESPAGGAEW